MGTIRTISIGMRADASLLIDAIDQSTRALDAFSSASDRTQKAVNDLSLNPARSADAGTGAGSGGEAGAAAQSSVTQLAAAASLMSQAFRSALVPVTQTMSKLEAMVNRAGGAVVTLARRLNYLIVTPKIEAALDRLQQRLQFRPTIARVDALAARLRFPGAFIGLDARLRKFEAEFDHFTARAVSGVALVTAGIALLGSRGLGRLMQGFARAHAASQNFTVSVTRGILGIGSRFLWAGDVAKRSLSKMFTFDFKGPIVSVQKFSTALGGIASPAAKATSSIAGFGKQLLIAFGLFGAAYKVADFFKSGIAAASGMNETLNKTGVIFKGSASIVTASADEMAKKYGTVKGTFMDVADGFGLLLTGMGREQQAAAAKNSVELARLAADASSIFNVPFEEAAGKISSALRGQSEPISAFGVDVSEAAVKAQAYAMHIAKVGDELTTEQKVFSRMRLVMEGLKVAQGDLANTIDDPANAYRRLTGNIANVGAAVGSAFMPAIKAGLGVLNQFTVVLMDAFERSRPTIDGFIGSVVSGIDQIGAVFRNLPAYWEVAKLKITESLQNLILLFEVLPQNLATIGKWIASNWTNLIVDAVNGVAAVFNNLATNIGNLSIALQDFARGKGFNFTFQPLLDGFKAATEEFPELAQPAFVSMAGEIEAQMGRIRTAEDARAKRIQAVQQRAARPAPLDQEKAEKQKKTVNRAKQIFEATRTPLEEYALKLKELNELFAAGKISADTFNRAELEERDKLKGKEGSTAEAITSGSKEAYSAQLKFLNQGADHDKPLKTVAKEAPIQSELLRQIALATGRAANAAAPQIPIIQF